MDKETPRELFDAEISAIRREIDTMKEAVTTANAAFEKRMEATNEWRRTLESLQAAYVTKEQVRWSFGALVTGGGLATAIYIALRGMG